MANKSNTTRLVIMAFLIALEIILTRFCSINTPILRIGFGFLPVAMAGIMFGPWWAAVGYTIGDLLGMMIFPTGAYFPGYTLTAVVGGLIWGLWLYPRKITVWRAIGAKTCINLFCNICLNTLWLTVTGGKAMSVLLVTRVPKNLILLPIEIVLVYFGMKLVNRIYGALPNGKTAAENS